MAEYRTTDDHIVVRRGGPGRVIAILVAIVALVIVALFATGFWRADVKTGPRPNGNMSGKGTALPSVDRNSKAVVVGPKKAEAEGPVLGIMDSEGT